MTPYGKRPFRILLLDLTGKKSEPEVEAFHFRSAAYGDESDTVFCNAPLVVLEGLAVELHFLCAVPSFKYSRKLARTNQLCVADQKEEKRRFRQERQMT